jgi:hypothetical protein
MIDKLICASSRCCGWPLALLAAASVNVFATVPEWAALAKEIGGDKAMSGRHQCPSGPPPHRGQALADRPGAGSQLVVATGADLEIGWLPVVLRESGNAGIQPGQPGYFEAAGRCACSRCRPASTGPTATCIPAATRTSSSTRATS